MQRELKKAGKSKVLKIEFNMKSCIGSVEFILQFKIEYNVTGRLFGKKPGKWKVT